MSEEALQIAENRREVKAKRKGKIYPSEYRVPKNSKERLKCEQRKEIQENNRMGNIRDLFKKISYKEKISCKYGHKKRQKRYRLNRSE